MKDKLQEQLSRHSSCLTLGEADYLRCVNEKYGGYPTLQQLWTLMDQAWADLGVDASITDEKLADFYRHPVWLLNGLFVEQDDQSIRDRSILCAEVASHTPVRILDFGGGFGSLARSLASALPYSSVEVLEPYPHPLAFKLSSAYNNLKYTSAITGKYDFIVASDVFEHLLDPIEAAYYCSQSLSDEGFLLSANCFAPVIECHLRQNLHFEYSWPSVIEAMGLAPYVITVRYALHKRTRSLSLLHAREAENLSRKFYRYIYPLIALLPRGKKRIGSIIYQALK